MAQEPELLDLDGSPDDDVQIPAPEVEVESTETPPPIEDDIEIEVVEDEPEPKAGLERDEDGDFGERVRKRIQREEKLKWQARKEAEEARAEAATARAELAKLRAEKQGSDIDVQVKVAREKFQKARADGDVEAETDAMSEVASLEAKKAAIRVEDEPAPARRSEPDNPAREKWMKRNAWYEDQKYDRQADVAADISGELIEEGSDPRSDAFWQELDRRLGESVKLPSAPKPQTPVAGAGTPPATPSGGKVRITREDKVQMAKFRLDPNNHEHLKQWAREKRANEGKS